MNEVSFYRCLASPTRLAVLKQLREGGEACVGDLAGSTGSEQTNLSHHLAELRACGLVATRQDGKRVCYRIAHPRLTEILALVEDFSAHVECAEPEACGAAGCC